MKHTLNYSHSYQNPFREAKKKPELGLNQEGTPLPVGPDKPRPPASGLFLLGFQEGISGLYKVLGSLGPTGPAHPISPTQT